jgi:hypothetical protein
LRDYQVDAYERRFIFDEMTLSLDHAEDESWVGWLREDAAGQARMTVAEVVELVLEDRDFVAEWTWKTVDDSESLCNLWRSQSHDPQRDDEGRREAQAKLRARGGAANVLSDEAVQAEVARPVSPESPLAVQHNYGAGSQVFHIDELQGIAGNEGKIEGAVLVQMNDADRERAAATLQELASVFKRAGQTAASSLLAAQSALRRGEFAEVSKLLGGVRQDVEAAGTDIDIAPLAPFLGAETSKDRGSQ